MQHSIGSHPFTTPPIGAARTEKNAFQVFRIAMASGGPHGTFKVLKSGVAWASIPRANI
jgi:hypothetical protein